MDGVKIGTGAAVTVLLGALLAIPLPALADTIESALVRAYQNNPQLNAQRAQVRATDEQVPQALSGYRPQISITANAGGQYSDSLQTTPAIRIQDAYPAAVRANGKTSSGTAGFEAPRGV